MAETLDNVSERLTRLEVTVAQGFHDAEQRDLALARKIDIQTEAIREDLRAAIDAINAFTDEARRTTDSLRKEHAFLEEAKQVECADGFDPERCRDPC